MKKFPYEAIAMDIFLKACPPLVSVQKELERKLADGCIMDPHNSIKVTEYKSHKFFVVESVQKPGPYPLTVVEPFPSFIWVVKG